MKTHRSKSFLAACCLILLLGHHGESAEQQYRLSAMNFSDSEPRAHRMEVYLLGQYWHSENGVARNVTVPVGPGPNPPTATGDIKFHAEDTGLWGFGVGYNFNQHLNINGEFTFGYPDYSLSFQSSKLTSEGFIQAGKFNLDYNLLSGPFTPFVSGGLGYLFFDTGIPSGPPEFICWWDEWWGETCVGNTPTYTETYFTGNAMAGLRWDISHSVYAKLYGGANWVNVGHSAGWLTTIQGTLAIGFKF